MSKPLSSFLHELPVAGTPDPPERFTFPFHYQPHPLALSAVADLQQRLETQTDWTHDFGHNTNAEIGTKGRCSASLWLKHYRNVELSRRFFR